MILSDFRVKSPATDRLQIHTATERHREIHRASEPNRATEAGPKRHGATESYMAKKTAPQASNRK